MTALRDIRVVDADSHIIEPEDLWTSRLPRKYQDDAPRVEPRPGGRTGRPRWRVGDTWLHTPGWFGAAGWPEYPPIMPETLDDIDPGGFDPHVRLERLDEYGIYAQTLYPNLIGFEAPAFMALDDKAPGMSVACVEAYNDYLIDFCAADPKRLVPIAMVPFWDLEASVREIKRCFDRGHKGILFANRYELIGLPPFYDTYWDPVFQIAQDLELSINFHVGFTATQPMAHRQPTAVPTGIDTAPVVPAANAPVDTRFTAMRNSIQMMISNAESIASIVTTGLCDRFPTLNFVSVESGMGYLPYLLDSLDWHWKGHGVFSESPMLPSEYFRRQCYGTFWFETSTLGLLEQYPDNFMFETDYPHATGMSPGPASPALLPADHIDKHFTDLSEEVAHKTLHDNAARVYHLD